MVEDDPTYIFRFPTPPDAASPPILSFTGGWVGGWVGTLGAGLVAARATAHGAGQRGFACPCCSGRNPDLLPENVSLGGRSAYMN